MKASLRLIPVVAVLALVSMLFVGGCTRTPPNPNASKDKEKNKDKDKDKDKHGHGEFGPHGGVIVEWEEIYHAEFTVDHAAKQTTVYVLDEKAKKAPKIAADKITKVRLSLKNVKPVLTIELKHDAKLSDDKGIAFVGNHEQLSKEEPIEGVIDANIDGKPFSGDFKYKPADKAKTAAVRKYYTQPGGIYTAADIKKNGTEKLKDLGLEHLDPKPGDKTCPVTGSKAHKEYTWVAQGQDYEFCCPPCLDTFLRWAHNNPEKIKNANDYVQKGM